LHPAYSVIFFTTASGAGYGLLILLAVFGMTGVLPPDRWFGVVSFGLALGLITSGLLASTFHLGHPERAWRAFGQWRSSWLSREGVASVVTYLPALAFAYFWVIETSVSVVAGLLTIAGALATLHCTGMIYASLKPIHAWHNRQVVPNYLALATATGLLLLNALAEIFGRNQPVIALVTVSALFLAFFLKRTYWRFIDTTRGPATVESATGLGSFGSVRLLDAPNTQENYVQTEMGYRIARKHSAKLRRIAFLTLFLAPLVLVLIGTMERSPAIAIPCAVLAALSACAGVLIERWLFFAEAKHAVTLYYGAREA
jgi:DMSO reductase anchor subunit